MPFMLPQCLLASGRQSNKEKGNRHKYRDKRETESCRTIWLLPLTSEEVGLVFEHIYGWKIPMLRIYWAPSADPKIYEKKMLIFEICWYLWLCLM